MLTQAVESLKSLEERNTAQGTRCYNILYLTYVKELAVEQIIRIVNISRRQYFYELKDSIEILTDRRLEGNAPVHVDCVGCAPNEGARKSAVRSELQRIALKLERIANNG